jgi:lysophospholipase L1-like esterase
MLHTHLKRSLAIIALAALAACGATTPPHGPTPGGPSAAPTPPGEPTLVGVGDSLTAGEQSDALLGVPTTSPLSAYPGGAVYPGQENGWFAILYDCVAGIAGATCNHAPIPIAAPSVPTNPSVGAIPLINAPGIGTQIVLNATTGLADTQSGCSTFNDSAFAQSGWPSTRVSATTGIADLGVPGITMHEAVAMTGPYEGPPTQSTSGCGYPTIKGDPTSGGLQSLVESENQTWLPVLGEFQKAYGADTTMLNVAVGMKPKVTTVWLGANDLLKYIFSAGTAPSSDTPQQMAADLTRIVKSLSATGSKVLVADLPTLLPTSGRSVPQFFSQTYLAADFTPLIYGLSGGAIPLPAASAYASAIVTDLGTQYGITAGGYLTESGFLATLEQALPLIEANPSAPNFAAIELDPSGPGSGLGDAYITPAFAAKIQALNAAYNQAIDSVATGSGSNVALVPINTLFTQISNSGLAVPGLGTVTLQFGGGLVSWDGLHPSDLGYAIVANEFISTADTSFGMTIPPLSAVQIGSIAANDPYDPFVLKAVNPESPFPLP